MAVHIETRGVPGVDGDDAITVVTMDRQERRNALEHQTLAELTAAVEITRLSTATIETASSEICTQLATSKKIRMVPRG